MAGNYSGNRRDDDDTKTEPFTGSLTPDTALVFHGEPEARLKLFQAIAQARSKFGRIVNDATGQLGYQKFKYAPLQNLIDACEPALNAAGVVTVQFLTGPVGDAYRVTTVVAGHGAEAHAIIEFARPRDVKELGKLSTYMRRYGYRTVYLLEGDDDADNFPERTDPTNSQKRREPPPIEPRRAEPARDTTHAQRSPEPAHGSAPRSVTPPPNQRPTSVPPRRIGTIPPPGAEPLPSAPTEKLERIKVVAKTLGYGRPRLEELKDELAAQDTRRLAWNLGALLDYQADQMLRVLTMHVTAKEAGLS